MTPSAVTDHASPLAWERAFTLARSHGHLWAQETVDDELVALHGTEAFETAVRERRERARETWPAPVGRAPRSLAEAQVAEAAACVDNAFPCGIGPSLAHTTGTGRLRWLVYESGAVTLVVSRPAPEGDVIRVDITPDGRVVAYCMGRYGWRHVEALHQALRALGVEMPMHVATFAEDDFARLAAGFDALAAETDALTEAARGLSAEAAADFQASASRRRARAEAFRTWARLRRPVLRGGTPEAYDGSWGAIERAQRAVLAVLFGGAA